MVLAFTCSAGEFQCGEVQECVSKGHILSFNMIQNFATEHCSMFSFIMSKVSFCLFQGWSATQMRTVQMGGMSRNITVAQHLANSSALVQHSV